MARSVGVPDTGSIVGAASPICSKLTNAHSRPQPCNPPTANTGSNSNAPWRKTAHHPRVAVTIDIPVPDPLTADRNGKQHKPNAGAIPTLDANGFKVVAIGSSTGGPSVVEEILSGLPADLLVPILVAQHMPANFTGHFAAQLDRATALSVMHAEDGMPVYAGVVYIALGHHHMRIRRLAGDQHRIEISPQPSHLVYKPSVDELFHSCVKVWHSQVLGVVLTGIGSDGTRGAMEIHSAGGVVLAQSAQTCAVYGMPKNCVTSGAATAQLDPADIAKTILQLSPEHDRSATRR